VRCLFQTRVTPFLGSLIAITITIVIKNFITYRDLCLCHGFIILFVVRAGAGLVHVVVLIHLVILVLILILISILILYLILVNVLILILFMNMISSLFPITFIFV
jgi:hypothetical protein